MADCNNDQECEKIVPTPIKPEPLPKQCSGGDESGGGTNDFNELDNRPKYDGRRMTGDTNIPAYSDFTGTDGQSAGSAGLVPAPTIADVDKFLKGDGTWGSAGGGGGSERVKILTANDYNWNFASKSATAPFDCVAVWLLEPGIYMRESNNIDILFVSNYNPNFNLYNANNTLYDGTQLYWQDFFIVSDDYTYEGNNVSIVGINLAHVGDYAMSIAIIKADGTGGQSYTGMAVQYVAKTNVTQNNLTSTSTWKPLAANQGKVLKDAIDELKPVVVWEVDGTIVTTGLVGQGEDISANPNWQLTNLNLTPYKRIKIYTKCAQKSGTTASASTTPAMVLEMSLDDRAAIAEYGGNFVGSTIAQKPNDANRLCTLTCAVSADKTSFEVLRMSNLYGTAVTSNSDVNGYVFKIEGYYY